MGSRPTLALLAALVLAGAVSAAVPQSRHWLSPRVESRRHDATRGRTSPASTGMRIALDHPLGGVGVGGFEHAYRDRLAREGARRAGWRSTPVVVVAETGAVGLLLLAWLLAEALLAPFRRPAQPSPGGRRRRSGS